MRTKETKKDQLKAGLFVDVLGNYSKNDADHLSRLVERVSSAQKRPPTSTKAKVQHRRLDRRLSDETITELVTAYRTGMSTNALCQQYGISKGGILQILADRGITMRQQPMTPDEIDQAVQLYVANKLSIRAIAKYLGKSKGSVWKALHERDVPMRPAH